VPPTPPPDAPDALLEDLLAGLHALARGEAAPLPPRSGLSPLQARLAEAFDAAARRQREDAARLAQVEQALEALARGDLPPAAAPLPEVAGGTSLPARLTRATDVLARQLARVASALSHAAREVGVEGRLDARAQLPEARGAWATLVADVNRLAGTFTDTVRDFAAVSAAVARGELSRRVTVELRGEPRALKDTVNTMVEQLTEMAGEVARVAQQLPAAASAPRTAAAQPAAADRQGVWKDLSDNVSFTEQLARASRSKTEFLAHVTHELRTPLNSLLILARVLTENRDQRLSAREVEYARTIFDSGTDLLSLVNELLDHSKVQAGKMRVDPVEVPLAGVRARLESGFRPLAEQRGLAFSVEVDADVPATLHTDPQRLGQVLKNLLSNAFKFTAHGSVGLRVRRLPGAPATPFTHPFTHEALRAAPAVLAFEVTDTGIGIGEAQQRRIFEPYEQAEVGTSRAYGGTGLGLSISRELAGLLGGELHLHSRPGEGSTFTLYLPVGPLSGRQAGAPAVVAGAAVRAPAASPPVPSSVPALVPEAEAPTEESEAGDDGAAGAALAGRKVLVVDDDIRHVFALTGVLEARGMKVLYAEDGQAGLAALRAHPDVEVVLMDLVMPVLGGLEAIQALRAEPRFASLPLVAVSAHGGPEERERLLAAGASAHLSKPVSPGRLLALLHRLLPSPAGEEGGL
jgi:signal transduction histidine kinase/CheY-like chemotaxis protein